MLVQMENIGIVVVRHGELAIAMAQVGFTLIQTIQIWVGQKTQMIMRLLQMMKNLGKKEWVLEIMHPIKWIEYKEKRARAFKQPKGEYLTFEFYLLDEKHRKALKKIKLIKDKNIIIGVDPTKEKDVSVKTLWIKK